jgi:hypothetical protein
MYGANLWEVIQHSQQLVNLPSFYRGVLYLDVLNLKVI